MDQDKMQTKKLKILDQLREKLTRLKHTIVEAKALAMISLLNEANAVSIMLTHREMPISTHHNITFFNR